MLIIIEETIAAKNDATRMDNFAKLEDTDADGNAREIRNSDMVNPIPPRIPTVIR